MPKVIPSVAGMVPRNVAALKPARRGLARRCLDWTERAHHLARPLGVHLLGTLCAAGGGDGCRSEGLCHALAGRAAGLVTGGADGSSVKPRSSRWPAGIIDRAYSRPWRNTSRGTSRSSCGILIT
jgi:hypothetical protein